MESRTEPQRVADVLSALGKPWLLEVVDGISAAVLYVSDTETIEFVNEEYARWWQLPRSEILGRTVEEFLGEDAYPDIKRRIDRLLAGESLNFYKRGVYPAGTWMVAGSAAPRYERGIVTGYFLFLQRLEPRGVD